MRPESTFNAKDNVNAMRRTGLFLIASLFEFF